jgi:Arc/MetJ-type ribon-helix-helix transcriptional regulator
MKTLTVRLPETLVAEIAAESRKRGVSKSDVVRERLGTAPQRPENPLLDAVADLAGSVKGLPRDLSRRKKHYLRAGFGRNRTR